MNTKNKTKKLVKTVNIDTEVKIHMH